MRELFSQMKENLLFLGFCLLISAAVILLAGAVIVYDRKRRH